MWWSQRDHKCLHKMAHTRCMLDKQDYKHALTPALAHTYKYVIFIAFSRQQIVSRTILNVTLFLHCLSCYYRFLPSWMFPLLPAAARHFPPLLFRNFSFSWLAGFVGSNHYHLHYTNAQYSSLELFLIHTPDNGSEKQARNVVYSYKTMLPPSPAKRRHQFYRCDILKLHVFLHSLALLPLHYILRCLLLLLIIYNH
jgi:hypothetical protein